MAMRVTRVRAFLVVALALSVSVMVSQTWAQTTTTGDISGVITDPTGAVVPNASVNLKSVDNGGLQSGKSNAAGAYHFSLLRPGDYTITVTASGFQSVTRKVTAALGGDTPASIQLAVSSSTETVEVVGQTASVETEDANLNTNFDSR